MDYFVYIIINENQHIYTGITNNLVTRINKHNLGKGAKATRKSTRWTYYKIYGNFTKSEALSFEWYSKHTQSKTGKWSRVSGLENKIKNIIKLLEMDKWKNIKEILLD